MEGQVTGDGKKTNGRQAARECGGSDGPRQEERENDKVKERCRIEPNVSQDSPAQACVQMNQEFPGVIAAWRLNLEPQPRQFGLPLPGPRRRPVSVATEIAD